MKLFNVLLLAVILTGCYTEKIIKPVKEPNRFCVERGHFAPDENMKSLKSLDETILDKRDTSFFLQVITTKEYGDCLRCGKFFYFTKHDTLKTIIWDRK